MGWGCRVACGGCQRPLSNISLSAFTRGRGGGGRRTTPDGGRALTAAVIAMGGRGGTGALLVSASGRSTSTSRTHSEPQHLMNLHLLFWTWWSIFTAQKVKLARTPEITATISMGPMGSVRWWWWQILLQLLPHGPHQCVLASDEASASLGSEACFRDLQCFV